MNEKIEYICSDCNPKKIDRKLVRKCLDCGCEYCNHSVPKLGIAVTPNCPKCGSTNVTF